MSDHHVCPWWLAYTFDNPLRRLIHNPEKMLGDYVGEGMTVMDIGCGMGYFALGMAELVGDTGKVIAVDLQQKMLDIMLKRAARKGLLHRIVPHRAEATAMGVTTPVDFALAFWMVHEVPDPALFFQELVTILRPSAKLLYTEPAFHVSQTKYNDILAAADRAGMNITETPAIRFSRAALLERGA
jgi:ubiquinone/menaquinone biosynthesis C-methylase UbiE